MRILSLNDIHADKGDFEARNSGWRNLVGFVVFGGGAAVPPLLLARAIVIGEDKAIFILFTAVMTPIFLLGTWVCLSLYRAGFKPENWVVRTKGLRVWIKYRHFGNRHFPREESQIIELEREEIEFVRETKATKLSSDRGSTNASGGRYLDFGVRPSLATPIADAIAAEASHAAVGTRRHQSKISDMPVEFVDGIIRVAWRTPTFTLLPSLTAALQYFGSLTRIESQHKETQDFTESALRELPRDQQIGRLKTLYRSKAFDAVGTTKRLFKVSTEEAKRMLEAE